MSVSNQSTLTSFEAEAMRDAVAETVEGTLQVVAEFDMEAFNILHADELTLSVYGDEERMLAHFQEIHSYVNVEFTEISFYTDDLFPVANEVRYQATSFDAFTALRFYFDDEGLFVALDPGEPVEPVVEAVEAVREDAG